MAIFGIDVPFAVHCGIEEVGLIKGGTRIAMTPAPHHINNYNVVHGGAICTMLDIALATAARTQIGHPVMTIDLQISFIGPGIGRLIGEGRVLRAGRKIVFCEGDVRQENGTLVAKATGVFMPKARPAKAGDGEETSQPS